MRPIIIVKCNARIDYSEVQCKKCNQIFNGGTNQLKQHIVSATAKNNERSCSSSTKGKKLLQEHKSCQDEEERQNLNCTSTYFIRQNSKKLICQYLIKTFSYVGLICWAHWKEYSYLARTRRETSRTRRCDLRDK